MAQGKAISVARGCPEPEINGLITAYCFGHASEKEQRLVAVHILECRVCWQEVKKLQAAVGVLKTDRSLMKTVSPTDFAAAVGISSKLDQPLGGHLWHGVISGSLFGVLYAVALLVEIAYDFDRYRTGGLLLAPLVFVWVLAASLGGMWLDWRRTSGGLRGGWWMALLVELTGIGLLFAGICLFLPAVPITKLTFQAYTAQAAYLKTMCYFVFLQSLFAVLPFHFVVGMQRELQEGRHHNALRVLTGDRMGIAPRGVFPIRFWVLTLLLAIIIPVSLFLHHNLMSNLVDAPGMNLFANLLLVRLLLFYFTGVECLIWFHRSLNELKRECLMALPGSVSKTS